MKKLPSLNEFKVCPMITKTGGIVSLLMVVSRIRENIKPELQACAFVQLRPGSRLPSGEEMEQGCDGLLSYDLEFILILRTNTHRLT